MIKMTEEMQNAAYALKELSASDPAVLSNMIRHTAAYGRMLRGRGDNARRAGEPQILSGFALSEGEDRLFGKLVRHSATDLLYLEFDVDDAAAPALALHLFSKEADNVRHYANCRLWSPTNGGRALVVPVGAEHVFHFVFQSEEPLKPVIGSLPGNPEAGFRRADTRVARLLSSADLCDVHRTGFVSRLHNEGQDIFGRTTRAFG
ncbi:hypothetical protein [Sphingomonas montana]|uniref:hypothetical protein n=1 Tax=Sphingomonas montana TaxID=1843236 RepID=UPI00101AED32|nr:hypothetical protein [Sphingomonas montana]